MTRRFEMPKRAELPTHPFRAFPYDAYAAQATRMQARWDGARAMRLSERDFRYYWQFCRTSGWLRVRDELSGSLIEVLQTEVGPVFKVVVT